MGQTPLVPGLSAPLPAEIKVTSNHLTLDVKIDGAGPFRFVVDTGADRSILAEDVATTLGLQLGKTVLVEGIVRTLPARTVPIRELTFGSVTCTDLSVPVLPRTLLQADGYLGLDTIGGHRVVFDFKNRVMEVLEPLPSSFLSHGIANESRIPAPGFGGHLRAMNCRVDGVSTVAFIDTGAEVSAGNPPLLAALIERNAVYNNPRSITLSGITGGSSLGRVVQVGKISLYDLEFMECELAIADLQVFKIWDLTDKPALLIGLNFLREFSRVLIDYGRKEIRMNLATANHWVNRRG